MCQDTRSGGLNDLLASAEIGHDALVDLSRKEAFEAPDDLAFGSAIGGASGDVVAGGLVESHADDDGAIEGGVGVARLWTSTVVGRRSYRNTLALVRDVASRMTFTPYPVIVTDGFEFYGTVIRRVFGPAALYAQVIKTRRHDRVVRVDRRAVIGAAWRFDEALARSEDSSTVNTSFIERLNLTIRQSSAYLSRRTLSHARATDTLDAHLDLLRYYYNFVRTWVLAGRSRESTRAGTGIDWILWVANYYSARNPLRLSSLVILGVVARMFRCATRSSCWCT